MAKNLLFFSLAVFLFICSVLFFLDTFVRHPDEQRIPAAVVLSEWAGKANDAFIKFYQDHVEIKE